MKVHPLIMASRVITKRWSCDPRAAPCSQTPALEIGGAAGASAEIHRET